MSPARPARPAAPRAGISAMTALLASVLTLTPVSMLLYLAFTRAVGRGRGGEDAQIEVTGWPGGLWGVEFAKLAIIAAVALLWYGTRRGSGATRVAGMVVLAGCVVVYLVGAAYRTLLLMGTFMAGMLIGSFEALFGADPDHLPSSWVLGLGAVSVVADLALAGVAASCLVMAARRSARRAAGVPAGPAQSGGWATTAGALRR